MIVKGYQYHKDSKNNILVVLQRDIVRPKGISDTEWRSYMKHCQHSYRLKHSRTWWMYAWPDVVKEVNVALARHQHYTTIPSKNVAITISDHIQVAAYDVGGWQYGTFTNGKWKKGFYHPAALLGFLRFDIDWWNENIDKMTQDIFNYAKELVRP